MIDAQKLKVCTGCECPYPATSKWFWRSARQPGRDEHTRTHSRYHGVPVNELRDAAEALRLRQDARYAELFSDVCLVGGHLYLQVMRLDLVGAQYSEGCWTIDPRARVTEINASIGIMRQQLRAWICDGDRAILEPMA